MNIPKTRQITMQNATEVTVDRIPTDDGREIESRWPSDDGQDVPGWEYETLRTMSGEVYRVPVRQTEH
ncbi:hypothetical protein [Devosia ginsengisoli]|uniref:Uncharacterized protein n=1 Tax=Devosia ginsengisoli TaxID=400770 RepID=A0A5B8LTC4_9HYPH|nr:hypothetical protein [Devosia ginsengisoli]QDZ10520.1 hypothetical protein FPZ08_07010 [Devosia ginsengisoli]